LKSIYCWSFLNSKSHVNIVRGLTIERKLLVVDLPAAGLELADISDKVSLGFKIDLSLLLRTIIVAPGESNHLIEDSLPDLLKMAILAYDDKERWEHEPGVLVDRQAKENTRILALHSLQLLVRDSCHREMQVASFALGQDVA